MTNKIDFSIFRTITGEDAANEAAEQILKKFSKDNPPPLGTILLNEHNGGIHLQHVLDKQQREAHRYNEDPYRWKILVLRDERGNVPMPGDTVYRPVAVKRKGATPDDLSIARRDGTFEEKYVRMVPFKIDAKGCISCAFSDAIYFLQNYGVMYGTRKGIAHKPERSKTMRTWRDGHVGYRYNWLYSEVSKDEYDKLPKRAAKKETEPQKDPEKTAEKAIEKN